jgi:hypothetical protein
MCCCGSVVRTILIPETAQGDLDWTRAKSCGLGPFVSAHVRSGERVTPVPLHRPVSLIASVYRGFKMEARVGIEPTHKGFADLSLTAWVPRHLEQFYRPAGRNRA